MQSSSSSSLKREISSAFRGVGHPSFPPALLSQVAALSTSLRLSPTQLAETWEAHSLTKNVEALNDATLAGYRNALAKAAGSVGGGVVGTTPGAVAGKNVAVIGGTGLGKRTAPGGGVTPSPASKRAATPGSVATTPPDRQRQHQRDGLSAVDEIATPSGGGASSPASKTRQPGSSPSMIITPTKRSAPKYADRASAGAVVASYNPHGLPAAAEVLAGMPAGERERAGARRGAVVSRHPGAAHPDGGFRHMFTPLEKRAAALEERLNGMSDAMCDAYGIRNEEEEMVECMEGIKGQGAGLSTWTPVGLPKQNKVFCVGRICNEAHEGKLNSASIRLEGSRQHSSGSRIQLDLQGLDRGDADQELMQGYSFFPGQIVAVEGINSSGRTMQASRLLEGAPPPEETLARSELLDYHYGSEGQDGRPLSIVSMCGPYTTRDNLDYDPLVDAVFRISKDKPDVVVMCGPFVDGRQPLIAGGEPTVTDQEGNARKVSYEHLFANKISCLLEEMYSNDPKLKTQFVLVPSMHDAFLDAVYPQPPFEDRLPGVEVPGQVEGEYGDLGLRYVELAGRKDAKEKPRRVHCVSNPCTLRINDLTLGVTSTDVLRHISSDERNAGLPSGTRLARIAGHLVRQRSYYPLFPAAEGASLDLGRAEGWEMPVRPDVLIVPSKLASFARTVCETTIVVNPGELTKNETGGTYAVVDVHPMRREALEGDGGGVKREGATEEDERIGKQVQDRVRVDIKRI